MAKKAWGGAAATSRGAHQPPALLCGICPGIALLGGRGSALLLQPPGHVLRSLGHAEGTGKWGRSWSVESGLGRPREAFWRGPQKHVRRAEEGEGFRRLLQISKGRAALPDGARGGERD